MKTPSRVSLTRCSSYGEGLDRAVEDLLAPLGGLASFVKPGQSVLVKPNLLTDRRPDEAVTTHPELVRVVLRLLKKLGAHPSVADCPNNVVKLEIVWEKTGYSALCASEKVPLVNLEKAGSEHVSADGYAFQIARPVLEADVIINMPKVKTHMLTIFTGAVKNMYGAVPGFLKTAFHKNHPTPGDFGCLLAAICKAVPPALNIADAVVGMQGDGPSAGDPLPLNFLAASADAVALDIVLCDILRIPVPIVPYLLPFAPSHRNAAGKWPTNTVGASPASLSPKSFRVPSTLKGRLIPGPLVKILSPLIWVRPVIGDKCVQCGRCAKACPAGALSFSPGTRPVLSPRRCVSCCCCHEICPSKAITMIQSPLLRLVKGKDLTDPSTLHP